MVLIIENMKEREMHYVKNKKEYSCALLLANDLIGGKWKLRILWHISHGDNRFSLLTKAIPDISQKCLQRS